MHAPSAFSGRRVGASIVLFTEQYWWCNVLLSEPAGGTLSKELNEPGYFLLQNSAGHVRATTQTGRQYDDDEARPHVSRIAEACDGSSARELRLYLAAQPRLLKT
jgi:hypothetical protein